MANTLGITEVTMAQLVLVATTINTRAARPDALSTGGPLVVRVSNHADNDAAEVSTDTDKMAIFSSKAYGHPWVKDTGLVHKVASGGTVDLTATVVFPDYDYSTFE